MSGVEVFGILAIAGLAWFWYDSLRAREAAIRAAREICSAEGLQLLDYTVSGSGLKPVRREDGWLEWQRAYDFEFSDTGNNRLKGNMVLRGRRLIVLNVGLRDAPTVRTLH